MPGWGGLGVVPMGMFLHMATSWVLLFQWESVGEPKRVPGSPEAKGLTCMASQVIRDSAGLSFSTCEMGTAYLLALP